MEPSQKFEFSDYQKAELENAFKLFHPNEQGKINLNTIKDVIHNFENQSRSSENTQITLNEDVFPTGTQECDFDQFIKIIEDMLNDPESLEKSMMHTFRLLDFKKSGYIDKQDLMSAAEILGERIADEEEA